MHKNKPNYGSVASTVKTVKLNDFDLATVCGETSCMYDGYQWLVKTGRASRAITLGLEPRESNACSMSVW